jgi:hypothetical protein
MAFLFHARAQLTTILGRAWGRLHHLRHVTSLTGRGNLTSVGSLLCDAAASRRPEMHRRPWHGLVRSDLQCMRRRCTRPRAVPPLVSGIRSAMSCCSISLSRYFFCWLLWLFIDMMYNKNLSIAPDSYRYGTKNGSLSNNTSLDWKNGKWQLLHHE